MESMSLMAKASASAIFPAKREFPERGNCCSCMRVVAVAYVSVPDGLFVELDAFETGRPERRYVILG
jgi:hypothetical protein